MGEVELFGGEVGEPFCPPELVPVVTSEPPLRMRSFCIGLSGALGALPLTPA